MSTHDETNLRGVAAVAAGAIIIGCALFGWGMLVGQNDARQLAAYEARMYMAARGVCGPGSRLVRTEAGHHCIYREADGTEYAQLVVEHPAVARVGDL